MAPNRAPWVLIYITEVATHEIVRALEVVAKTQSAKKDTGQLV